MLSWYDGALAGLQLTPVEDMPTAALSDGCYEFLHPRFPS